MAFQGIDLRQTGDRLVFRASLKDTDGAVVASGTTNLRLYEVQSDGSLKSYDWNDNTFKTGALTTEHLALTHRPGNNSTTNTGIWTGTLTTLTGFTAGNLYIAQVSNTGASPPQQEREFQFGVSSAFNPFDSVRGGLTALPNAAADAAGGLVVSDAGGLNIDGVASNVSTIAGWDLGTNGSKASSIPWNAAWDAEVQSEVNDALTAFGAATESNVNTVKSDTAAILLDTNELQTDLQNGGRLDLLIDSTVANTVSIKAVTDQLPDSGALTTIAANVTSILGDTNELQTDLKDGGRLDALLDAVYAYVQTLPSAAAVNAELVDVLAVDTQTIPGQGTPPSAPTLAQAIAYLYKLATFKRDSDGSTAKVYGSDDTTVDHEQTIGTAGGVTTVSRMTTGA